MASSTGFSSFQSNWAKTLDWAKKNNIPASSYLPVYQQDSQYFLKNGYGQGTAAITRQITAAAGLGVTQIPGDNPSPTDVVGNIKKNATDIFTSLNPTKIVSNLFDTAKNAIEHPEQAIVQPAIDLSKISTPLPWTSGKDRQAAMKDFSANVLAPDSPWALLPGAYDAAQLYRGKAGLNELATNPITAILDVAPLDRIPMTALSKTAFGAKVAEAAGVHVDELAKLQPQQLAWKLLKKRPSNITSIGRDATGQAVIKDLSTGEQLDAWRNHHSIGKDQGMIAEAAAVHNQQGTIEKIDILKPLDDAASKLSIDDKDKVDVYASTVYHQTDFRTDAAILNDSSLFTPAQSEYFQATIDIQNKLTEWEQNFGTPTVINTASGPETYFTGDNRRAAAVIASKDQLDAVTSEHKAASAEFNTLLLQTQDVDSRMAKFFPQFKKLTSTVNDAIKSSLPDLTDTTQGDTLRKALPSGEKFDRGPRGRGNLETFLGLDEKTVQVVVRNGKEVEPFTDSFSKWSEPEKAAWNNARQAVERIYHSGGYVGDKELPGKTDFETGSAPRSLVKKQALDRLKLTSSLSDKKVHASVSGGAARNLTELVSTGGLLDQMYAAFDMKNFDQLKDLSTVASRKLHNKSFQSPTASPALKQLVGMVDGIKKYSTTRDSITRHMDELWNGRKIVKDKRKGTLVSKSATKKSRQTSILHLANKVDRAKDNFLKVSNANPPSVWDNYTQRVYSDLLAKKEAGAKMADDAIAKLGTQGLHESNLQALRTDPQALNELIDVTSTESMENHMLPNVETGIAKQTMNEARQVIADARAKGLKPMYLPTLHVNEIEERRGDEGLYNVNIGKTRISSEQRTHEKLMSTNTTLYNMQAGMHKAVHEFVTSQHEIDFQANDIQPFLYSADELYDALLKTGAEDMKDKAIGPDRPGSIKNYLASKVNDMDLVEYDPKSIFSSVNPKFNGKTMYINKDILAGMQQSFNRLRLPGSDVYDKATGLFRTSILGYSPRFTAHIAIGGTMLLAGKSSITAFKEIPEALHIARTGKLSDRVISKFNISEPEINKIESRLSKKNISAQEGAADNILHHARGYSAAQLSIQERIAEKFGKDATNLKNPNWMTHWLSVVPEFNLRITRFLTSFQKSIAFLDGSTHAGDHFFMDDVDESGKQIRTKVTMSPEQRVSEGMKHVNEVMGNVLNMTPIEQNFLTRLFPFWGWTKHVLTYVAKYPTDHPYRAMMLTQQARIQQQQLMSGLPLRTQLLFFLGAPDAQGNVKAVDARAANPLRDTAQYATLGGWLSALNPIITAPVAQVDPNITYGTNVLYPNITYNDLYGTNEAGPQGGSLNAIESVVPEVSTLDAAFNLSGKYSYLQGADKGKLYKQMFDSLNIPFLQEQSLNLRQIAATNEKDRYQQANKAASDAWKSGDFSTLSGYGAVPDPRGDNYNITPANLKKVYDEIAASSNGLPPSSVAQDLPTAQY